MSEPTHDACCQCQRDDHARVGDVTAKEAHESLCRFVASHFRDGRERARFTIPTDLSRDDDVRLSAFICRAAADRDRIAATVAWARGRMADCDAVVRGEVELHGTDLPEALAERRALRTVIAMLEGRDV
jgi:hypothetical protein